MPRTEHYRNEREAWEDLRTPHAYETRAEIRKEFQSLFPHQHKTSLRSFISYLTDKKVLADVVSHQKGELLSDVHSDSLPIIEKYGVSYRPWCFHEPPALEPKPYGCFENAYKLMSVGNLYVEGIIFGAVCKPMLHAWNVSPNRPRTAIDWTFYSGAHWIRYFGISLTKAEYTTLVANAFPELGDKRKVTTLFHVRDFERIKPHLVKLLERRAPLAHS